MKLKTDSATYFIELTSEENKALIAKYTDEAAADYELRRLVENIGNIDKYPISKKPNIVHNKVKSRIVFSMINGGDPQKVMARISEFININ